MFALVECGQERCHLPACPLPILPQNSCQHHMFAIINFTAGRPLLDVKLVFSLHQILLKNNAPQLLINHASLIKVYASMVQICGHTILFLSLNWKSTMASILSISKEPRRWILNGLRESMVTDPQTSKLYCPPAAISVPPPHCKSPELDCPALV